MNGNTVLMYIFYPGTNGHFALGALLPKERKVLYADSLTTGTRRDQFFQSMRKFLTWINTTDVVELEGGKESNFGRQQTFERAQLPKLTITLCNCDSQTSS